MQMIYFYEIVMVLNVLLNPEKSNQPLFGSFPLEAFLCLLMILMTLWSRDFWRGFGFQLKLKELFLFKYNLTAIFREKLVIPDLPKSDKLPSNGDMAKLLVKALPASERPEAYRLLVTQLLPKRLARLPSFFERRKLVEISYKSLADALQEVRANQRLKVLRAELYEAEINELSSDSLMLAIARYMQEHPDATPKNQNYWLDFEEVSKWSAMPTREIEDKATRLSKKLKEWEKVVEPNYANLWEEYRIRTIHIELNLGSARSGIYPTAMGNLASFLHAMGASFKEMHLH